ncbi:hypothetical protein SteCoe_32208 [Stentor coeruleus]|uniref:Protein-tyrosine-phosphatase n=1 Tax=Stentor coeruleus TaxID=5963 RepID=A0A1R2AZJ7_9CILI|nr:hypothetical protein SteCoe_32208 [Stentor coeruleus]
MKKIASVIKTATGEMVISGPLPAHEDLSYFDLGASIHFTAFELGRNLKNYRKLSLNSLIKEFHAVKIIFEQGKYLQMYAGTGKMEMYLNRYEDCLPCIIYIDKRNLVHHDPYINASYISGIDYPEQKDLYIATQAPLPYTISHFWHMVLNQQVGSIFTLCQPLEIKKVTTTKGRCEEYWPAQGKKATFNDLTIENKQESNLKSRQEREIEITYQDKKWTTKQIHFTNWPDKSIPSEKDDLEQLVNELQNEEKKKKKIIIHCSAGVGRTGTLLALTQLKTLIDYQKNNGLDLGISVFSIVRRLREQRVFSVQTIEQYEMINDFVEKWVNRK